jgi:hypothetical protein
LSSGISSLTQAYSIFGHILKSGEKPIWCDTKSLITNERVVETRGIGNPTVEFEIPVGEVAKVEYKFNFKEYGIELYSSDGQTYFLSNKLKPTFKSFESALLAIQSGEAEALLSASVQAGDKSRNTDDARKEKLDNLLGQVETAASVGELVHALNGAFNTIKLDWTSTDSTELEKSLMKLVKEGKFPFLESFVARFEGPHFSREIKRRFGGMSYFVSETNFKKADRAICVFRDFLIIQEGKRPKAVEVSGLELDVQLYMDGDKTAIQGNSMNMQFFGAPVLLGNVLGMTAAETRKVDTRTAQLVITAPEWAAQAKTIEAEFVSDARIAIHRWLTYREDALQDSSNPMVAPAEPNASPPDDLSVRLQQLSSLLQTGQITQEEFAVLRNKALGI